MIKTEKRHEDKMGWEAIIKPKRPEQPLIRVERQESGEYKALFALELEGVVKSNKQPSQNQEQDTGNSGFSDSLIACLSANQKLQFVYSGERSAQGRDCFNWRIVGSSTGSEPESAIYSARQLWQGLSVLLGSSEKEYRFTPVNAPENLVEADNDEAWVGMIMTSGIAIDGGPQRKIGFNADKELDCRASRVIVPFAVDKPIKNLDSVVVGASRCPAPVKLVLSITPFTLSTEDMKKVGSALEWLQNGEKKHIMYHDCLDEGIEELKVVNGLKRNLSLWLKSPSGFRVSCKATSKHPIPVAFLKMVGGEVFHGCPITVNVEDHGNGNGSNPEVQEVLGSETLESETLDLRGCINGASALPPLFPQASTLMDFGFKRAYKQSSLRLSDDGILLGRTGSGRDVRFAGGDRSRHCYIVGATGTGKSTLLYNMIAQDIRNGEGVAVIDPHGDLYQQLLTSIPKHRADDVVLIDPSDYAHSVGINFLECEGLSKRVQTNFVVNEMIKIFDRLYDMRVAGGPIFEQYMRNAMLLVMESDYPAATLMDVPFLFEDKEFREFLLERCKNPIVRNFWKKQAEEAGGDASLRNMAPYITSKLNQFTTNGLLRPIIGQHKSTVDFRELIDTGKILLVNLSKGLLGEMDTQLLGMLIIGKIFTAAMGRTTLKAEQRKPMFLYVDEFQNFTTDTVAHLLSEARKFGLFLTLANQNLAQLSANSGKQNILDAVLGNVGTTLIFRLGAVDADKMQIYTRPELDAQDLQDLPDFHMAGRLLVKNCPSRPFVSRTLPNGKVSDCADAESIIEASREKYAVPTEKVEEEIIKRRSSDD